MAENADAPEAAGKAVGTVLATLSRALLWTAVAACVFAAYLAWSGPGGPLPRPDVVNRFLMIFGLGPWGASLWGGIWALILASVVAVGAVGSGLQRERERALMLALEAEPGARAVTGAKGALIWRNAPFAALTDGGQADTAEALVGRLDGKATAARFNRLKETAAAGGAADGVFRVRTPGGALKWLRIQVRPFKKLTGWVLWCVEDITARRRMELDAEEERRRLIGFLDDAKVAFYVADAEGRIEFVNRPFAELVGKAATDLTDGRHHLADLLVTGVGDPSRPYSALPAGTAGDRGKTTFRRSDGATFPAEVMEVISGETGQGNLQTHAVVRDLSAEQEFEDALAHAEARFRTLFEEAPSGIAILDADMKVSDCNAAFCRVAAAGEKVAGRPIRDLVADDDRPVLEAWLAEAAAGAGSGEVLNVHLAEIEDGEGALHATPLHDAEGATMGLILHLLDTTQHRRLEAQFTQSQKLQAVGQLAGGIAHDFNNLLTVMIGFCDLILQRHRPGDQTFADIMQIKQNANRAANLVRQLLAFSRQQTLQPTVINITDVLAELSNLLSRLLGVNITLDVIHGRDLNLVKVDQVQFEQVIINLAVNARDAMKAGGGTLTITTANADIERPQRLGSDVMPPGRYVSISVADTGTGIARVHLERIFDPFFSTKEVGAGTGLGLSTVYGIVSQTGGFVKVDSVEGQGTTFTIYLPVYEPTEEEAAAEQASAAEAAAPARDTSGVGTVLLVEDEDPVRLFGARALRNKGYQVLEAKNGDAAIAVLEDSEEPIDLVISDVVMPELDGPGLVREVRKRYPSMKVIFISGYAEDEFREQLERESDIHFLPKPFSLEQLAGKVKEVLAS
ncbi:MAG: PAS domain-containing protein [Alphaproteobacteria bacterium]|nr:PAS domain-containing protein [Alphaproteobacteria bacterium]